MMSVTQFQRTIKTLHSDARHWQIMALGGLFLMAWQASDFGTSPAVLLSCLLGAMTLELVRKKGLSGGPIFHYSNMSWKSALITALGVSILLRASDWWVWALAAAVAIASKKFLTARHKHLFNPACSGIVFALLVFPDRAWIAPGQWGQASLLAGYALAMAALTLSSAKRLDIALGFLIAMGLLTAGRALYLGDPLVIAQHQLSTGSLLIFSFFMITDPRSTPDSRMGRLLFAALVAALTVIFQWGPNLSAAPLLALLCIGLMTPAIDRIFPAERFRWRSTASSKGRATKIHACPPPQEVITP